MLDFLLLMHADAPAPVDDAAWGPYLATLRASGRFDGGSAIGDGACFAKAGPTPTPIAAHLTGYLRVRAASLEEATAFLAGNPVYEAGGTVEIRALPRD